MMNNNLGKQKKSKEKINPAVDLRVADIKVSRDLMARYPSDEVERLKESLLRQMQQFPIVVDQNMNIVKGTGIYIAALELGWELISGVVIKLDE